MKAYLHSSEELTLADLAKTISQKKGIIIKSVFITLIAALVVSLIMPAVYKATAKILIREESLSPSNVLPAFLTTEEFIKSQGEIIKSKPVIASALQILDSKSQDAKSKNSAKMDVASIQKYVSIDFISRTNILKLNVEHRDAKVAAGLANAITQANSNYYVENKTRLIDQALQAIAKEIDVEEEQLRLAEEALENYTRREKVAILPESEIVVDLKRFAGFDISIINVDSEIQKVDTKLEEVNREIKGKQAQEISLPFIVNNATIKDFQSKIRQAELKLSDLLIEYTTDHPEVIAIKNEIKKLNQDLAKEKKLIIDTEIETYEMEKKLLESRKAVLTEATANYGAHINKVLLSQPKLAQLLHEIDRRRSIYRDLLDKQRNLKILKERSIRVPDMQVIETARIPSRPVRPNLLLNCFLGLILGLTIGTTLALVHPVTAPKEERVFIKERVLEGYRVGKERREMIRSKISADVTYNLLDEPSLKHKSKSRDISASGIRITTDERLKKAAILEMQINIPGISPIFSRGEVIWSSEVSLAEDGKGPFSAGVKFVDMESGDEKRLANFLYRGSLARG